MSMPSRRLPALPSIAQSEADLEKAGATGMLAEPIRQVSKFLPLVMATALFMDLLDTAALGSTLPTLAREFHTDPVNMKLALTAYLMTMAILVPASGWLADRFGPRRVFMNAIRIYLLGSLCCGLSRSIVQLVAARVLQGMGGAMMTPVARMIVVASTPRERLVQALNAFTIPAVVGPMMGPPLAGLLLEIANWRWIFFINLPVGIIGMVAVLRIVPRLREKHPGPFDARGFALAAVGITLTMLLSESIGASFLSDAGRIAVLVATLLIWTMFVRHALHAETPMLDLRILAKPTYRASMLGGSLLRLGIGATPFLLPLLLQVGLGWSPVKAGTVMTAMMIGSILARFGGTFTIRLFGFRTALLVTSAITALFSAAPAIFSAQMPIQVIFGLLLGGGFFRAAHYVASSAIAFAEVRPDEVSRASTLSTVIQQLSMSFGVSLAGVTLYLSAGVNATLTTQDFVLPFVAIGVATLLAVPVYARLDPLAGAHMRFGKAA